MCARRTRVAAEAAAREHHASQPTVSRAPSRRSNLAPVTRPSRVANTSVTRASQSKSTPAALVARIRCVISAAPVFSGTVCIRSTLKPGYRNPVRSMNGTPWRSASHSIAGAEARATAATISGSASPWFLRRMSAASSSAESVTPAARWNRVPAAGTNPDEGGGARRRGVPLEDEDLGAGIAGSERSDQPTRAGADDEHRNVELERRAVVEDHRHR